MGNNPSKASEDIETLAEWSRTIAEYLTSNAPPHSAAAHMDLGEIIARARQKRDLRGMRTIAKDLAEWARFLPPALANQLDGLLRAKFGKGLREARQADLKRVQKILSKGKIANGDEYRLLASRADEIHADASRRAELEQINDLLAARDNPRGAR